MRTQHVETRTGSLQSPAEADAGGSELERYRSLFDAAPAPYLVTDREGRILEANPLAERTLHRDGETLRGQPLAAFVAPCDRRRFEEQLEALRAGPASRIDSWELRLQRASGSEFSACASVACDGARAPRIAWLLREDSEKRRLRAELREASAALILAEERERLSLSQDLHDDLGQLLSLVGMKIGRVRDLAGGSLREPMREIEQLVGQIVQRTTSLTFQLHPPVLQTEGLVAAAEWLALDLQRNYGLRVDIKSFGYLDGVEGPTRIILFRSLRELLVNVAKHAGTHHAEVRIWRHRDGVRVSVADRGKGFGARKPCEGFGLLSVRERLRSLGGRLELRAGELGGTVATLEVPLPHEDPMESRG